MRPLRRTACWAIFLRPGTGIATWLLCGRLPPSPTLGRCGTQSGDRLPDVVPQLRAATSPEVVRMIRRLIKHSLIPYTASIPILHRSVMWKLRPTREVMSMPLNASFCTMSEHVRACSHAEKSVMTPAVFMRWWGVSLFEICILENAGNMSMSKFVTYFVMLGTMVPPTLTPRMGMQWTIMAKQRSTVSHLRSRVEISDEVLGYVLKPTRRTLRYVGELDAGS